MRKYNLPYEDRDVLNNPVMYAEMFEKSGQELSPCVEINGFMLADVSGSEVEAYMLEKGLVEPVSTPADMPTDRACATHHHA
jgi:monothiol glutaredoxin